MFLQQLDKELQEPFCGDSGTQ